MAEFASKGVAGSGLGLGIAGTALGLLNGVLTPFNHCSENTPVNRYELDQESKIAELQSQIALRDANTYNDQKMLELYKYFDGEIKDVHKELCAQKVFNATAENATSVMASQIASINNTLASITKTIIPNSSVCPGWGRVCVQSMGCDFNNDMI